MELKSTMEQKAYIKLNDLSLDFRHYNGVPPSFRARVQQVFTGDFKRTKQFRALDQISLTINSGDRLGIVGGNGSGKTTLLKCIAGIYSPLLGSVVVRGRVVPLLELGSGFSMGMSARKNIYLNGAILGMSHDEMKAMENDILNFAGISDFADQPVISLSSGMKSRLGFSIASFLNPEILLLDEVFATGDISFVEKARAKMEGMIDQSHIVVVVSHQEDVIRSTCNRVVVLHHGQVQFDGDPVDALSFYHDLMKSNPKKGE